MKQDLLQNGQASALMGMLRVVRSEGSRDKFWNHLYDALTPRSRAAGKNTLGAQDAGQDLDQAIGQGVVSQAALYPTRLILPQSLSFVMPNHLWDAGSKERTC